MKRDAAPRWLSLAALCLVISLGPACWTDRGPSVVIDCGSFAAGHNTYESAGRECVWDAYTAHTAVRWAVRQLTIEGDPIPGTLGYDPGQGIVITRDVRADEFSGTADRRLWMWRCGTMSRRTWATDPSRYSFELTDCRGDGASTHFP